MRKFNAFICGEFTYLTESTNEATFKNFDLAEIRDSQISNFINL